MFVVKERREGRNMGTAAGIVMCGVLEHCLDLGLTSLTALMEMWWLPRFQEMGWHLIPLGLPELLSGEWSVAAKLMINHRTLVTTREYHNIGNRSMVPARAIGGRVKAA
jgi:acyl-homoserine lactone synthase